MDLTEKLLESNEVFEGKVLNVFNDRVRLPDGGESTREVVRHPGGACVCAIDKNLEVAFVRQFRYAYGMEILELPAGKLEKGEDPSFAASRELKEEAGLAAGEMLPLGVMYPSPGYTDEIIHMFLSVNSRPCENQPDDDEFLCVEKLHIGDALEKVFNGEIKDAKTQICLLKAYIMLQSLMNKGMEEMERGSIMDLIS